MMDTKSSKVTIATKLPVFRALMDNRYPNSMDGVEWNRHGIKLSRGRWMCCDMVSIDPLWFSPVTLACSRPLMLAKR